MKTIVRFLVMAVLAISVKSQSLPTIQSADVLRTYALGQPVAGYRSIESPSLVHTQDEKTWSRVDGNGAEDVLQKLFAEQLRYTVANVNDKIKGHLYLYDSHGRLVFYGYAEYTADEISGKQPPSYGIWSQPIALPGIKGVESAEILVTDENGHTNPDDTIRLDVEDGSVLFQDWLCGRTNGMMLVHYKDGTVATFSLSNPTGETPPTVSESDLPWQVAGHHVIRANQNPMVQVDIAEVYNLPTLYVEAAKGQAFTLNVQGLVQDNGSTSFERPTSYTFEQADGSLTGGGMLQSNTTSVIKFPGAGKFRVRFQGWKKFGQPGTLYSGPNNGDGGKG